MTTRRTFLASLCAAPLARAGSGPIAIPALRNDFHQLLVPARIEGSPPLWSDLDSGGGGAVILLEAAHADAIGVRAASIGRSTGPTEGSMAADGRAWVTLDLPGLSLPHQELIIRSQPLLGDKDASIGMLVLAKYVVEIDHDGAMVRLHDPGEFRYGGPGQAVPFTMENGNPFTTATLTLRRGVEVTAQMVIDTGAAGSTAYFSKSFAERIQLAGRALASAADSLGRSAARIERFAVGGMRVERPVVHHFQAPGFGGTAEPDGMIGVEFLRRFKVFLDYSRNRMILEKAAAYREPVLFDASGLRAQRMEGVLRAIRVYAVLPGTPAAEAGMGEGDVIMAVDDVPVQSLSPGMVYEALSRDGRECTLLVQRGYDILRLKLRLRKLL